MMDGTAAKTRYRDKKLDGRLRKYQAILKETYNINRLPFDIDSQVKKEKKKKRKIEKNK